MNLLSLFGSLFSALPPSRPGQNSRRLPRYLPQGLGRIEEGTLARQRSSGLVTDSWKFTGLSEVPVDRDDIANDFAGETNPDWKDALIKNGRRIWSTGWPPLPP